ncbi:MAG TPA: M23 family metallopeptidase [Candidatus Saccharimonadales bacterium]|nr:M23 family metallopeptidase [Candidatus Saccharimonadales bacterium]
MNPQTLRAIAAIFSMKLELKILTWVVVSIFLIPALAVLILTQAGLDFVSNALASGDQTTGQVAIHDPGNGQVVDYIDGPRMWPVSGPVTLEFGGFDPPYQIFHTGIDIADPNHQVGTPVAAFMKGTVIYAGEVNWGYGRHVVIDHGHHVTSIYGHLDTINVIVGQQVDMGTIIGTRGTTGWSTGPHLHFETRVWGIPVNPRTFLSGNP